MTEMHTEMNLDDLPSLKDLLIAHDLWAKKSLGQNFLLSPMITDRIASSANIKGKVVLEIGPGPGGLTRSLLRAGASHVIAVEKDPRCVNLLSSLVNAARGHLTLISRDALKLNVGEILQEYNLSEIHVVANLPYNIGTELCIRWLKDMQHIPTMTLMFQKEVAQRITATVNTSHYGRLAVLAQTLTMPRMMMELDPGSFTPPPKVTSCVVHFVRRPDYNEFQPLISALEKVTAAAFGQRRKMLRSSLKGAFSSTEGQLSLENIFQSLNITPTDRADLLSLADFHALALKMITPLG